MKNIKKGSIEHLILLVVCFSLAGTILYPLFDFLLCKFITNSEFLFSFYSHVIKPFLFCIIMGPIFWMIEKKNI